MVELPSAVSELMICYDLEFPEWVRVAALSGADLIAVPVNWNAPGSPVPPGERSGEVVSAQAAASANGVFIAVADRCLSERGVRDPGLADQSSCGVVATQRPGLDARTGQPCSLPYSTCRKARDKRISERNDLFTDRRPDLYARLSNVI